MPRPVLAVLALTVVPLVGCGGAASIPTSAHDALRDSAKVSAEMVRLSQDLQRKMCPKLVDRGGRDLTQRAARACIKRLADDYTRTIKAAGYDPVQVRRQIAPNSAP